MKAFPKTILVVKEGSERDNFLAVYKAIDELDFNLPTEVAIYELKGIKKMEVSVKLK